MKSHYNTIVDSNLSKYIMILLMGAVACIDIIYYGPMFLWAIINMTGTK